jgi:hypothetical protein
MRRKLPYRFFTLLNLLKGILFLLLIAKITVTPVYGIAFHQIKMQYELAEIFEDDFREKEIIIYDIEDEDQAFYFIQNLISFHFYKGFTDYNRDVLLPPPK